MEWREQPGPDSYHIWHFCGCSGTANFSRSWQCLSGLGRGGADGECPRERSGEMMKKMKWERAVRQEETRYEDTAEEVVIFNTSFHHFIRPSIPHTHIHTHTFLTPSAFANYQICWLGPVHLKLSVTVDGQLTGPFIQHHQSWRWKFGTQLWSCSTELFLQQ